jgi:hypothetical protein
MAFANVFMLRAMDHVMWNARVVIMARILAVKSAYAIRPVAYATAFPRSLR